MIIVNELGIDLKIPLTCSCGSRILGIKITGNAPGTESELDTGVFGRNTA